MQLSRKRNLPGSGEEVQLITGDPQASWVGEAEEIKTSDPTFAKKTLKGYKMGVIVPFSNEFRRDKTALYDEIVSRVPSVIANTFDKTVFGVIDKPGENFDSLADATSVDLSADVWGGLVTADSTVSAADGILNGWVLAPSAKALLLTTTDTTGRPIFINSPVTDGTVPSLLASPAHIKKAVAKTGTPNQIGVAGDWTSAQYGIVENIRMSISDQASIKIDGETINLFQNDMFAVRFLFTAGWRAKYLEQFVRLTQTAA